MAKVKAKVIFDYDATEDDELTLHVGDIVTNIDQADGGWWTGELNGKEGLFPENFVEVIPSTAATKPSIPSMQPKVRARVTFYYDAAEPDELSLKEGDIVEILSQDEEGWWEGLCNGKKGVFPANFVEVIKESASKEMPVPPGTPVKEQKDIEREELISFDEKSDKILGSEVELKPSTAEEETKKPRVASGMGFAISNADLFKTKLRPVSMVDDGKKPIVKQDEDKRPTQLVEPLPSSEPVSKAKEVADVGNVKRNAPAPPPANGPSLAAEERHKVLFDYLPENDDELGLKKGEIVTVTNRNVCEGWWEGSCNGKSGVFPNNFVEQDPITEAAPKVKVLPKKPILPTISKAPALPPRESKEDDSISTKPSLTEKKKPPIGEANKPSIADLKKALPAKPPLKPPPAVAKNKPVPHRPSEKPSLDEQGSVESSKLKPNTASLPGRAPSIGKRPLPNPSGFVRTLAGSLKRPIPAHQPDAKPEIKAEPKIDLVPELIPAKDTTRSSGRPLSNGTEEQGLDWNMPSDTQVLSNVNKNRVKGPGKALPGKYVQSKEQKKEESSQPPWKQEIIHKDLAKDTEALESQMIGMTKPTGIPESDDQSAVKEPLATQALDNTVVEDLKAEMKSMNDKMLDIEKRLMKHIEILTKDLDEERKERASLIIEVDRLKKRLAILEG